MISKALILLFLVGASLTQIVTTPDGPIQGVEEQTYAGKTYHAYYSIPYAKPPIGPRRFLASEQVDPWTETHDGTKEIRKECYQVYSDSEYETEDCLYLNVFAPQDLRSNARYPVIVNFHGGAYVVGSGLVSRGLSPNYIVNEDVIFVSPNFRLGAFGFLSTNDSVIPGNAGLSDQVQALKWVSRNIAAFGGDSTKVTIMGQSAGASSVGLMVLSLEAAGLFSAGIMQSGSPLAPWSYQRHAKEYAFKLGSLVDVKFESNFDSKALLKVLQEADAKVVDVASFNLTLLLSSERDAGGNTQLQQGLFYAPVLDTFSADSILPKKQYETLKAGDISPMPILIGVVSEEGLINSGQNLLRFSQYYDRNSSYLVPQAMHIDDEGVLSEVGDLIKREYSPNSSFVDNKLAGIQYFSEQDFDKSSVKHAELQSSGNVTHNEEFKYIFNAANLTSYPENDQLVSRRLVRLWTNFAKYYNPTPEPDDLLQNLTWPRVQPNDFNYVKIGNFESTDLIVLEGKPKAARMSFWDTLYEKYAVEPLDTY